MKKVEGVDFIREIIQKDLSSEKHHEIITRFPPEPNGYLHIGHAKSIVLNFGIANDGENRRCHLRFDDTNPTTEETEFVNSIQNDVKWLGFDWNDHLYFASDYFGLFYEAAIHLIKNQHAYVDSLNEEEIRNYRGTVTEPGSNSPYRNRSVEENLALFEAMKAGKYEDGLHVLRAKIDMSSPNMLMRDPVLYRIRHAHHHRTGDAWCIYPLYDYAHPLSDAIEGITHSICTLEFEVHRPLYDWVVDNTWDYVKEYRENRNDFEVKKPHQYEFARLNLDYTVMSKRKLLQLVNENYVNGWDDPRMPTIAGMRRRGITPEAIRTFAELVGVAKAENRIDIALLEYAIRNDLNTKAPRVLCVHEPLKIEITNYPEDQIEWLDGNYFPHDIGKAGSRKIPFGRELYIDAEDFMETPSKGFHRLTLGGDVRLKFAYIITCNEVVKDENGNIVVLKCTYDANSKSGSDSSGRKVKGTIHWVAAKSAKPCTLMLYDRLFTVPFPDGLEEDFKTYLNPDSAKSIEGFIEPSVLDDPINTRYQFERQGYYWQDKESKPDNLIFNRIVSLRDSWANKNIVKETPKKAEKVATVQKKRNPLDEKSGILAEKYLFYTTEYELPETQADILTTDEEILDFYESLLTLYANPKSVANWVSNEIVRIRKEHPLDGLLFSKADFVMLIKLVDEGALSNRLGNEVLENMVETGKSPQTIIKEEGLEQVSDPETLSPLIHGLIDKFPEKASAYRAGKTGLKGFFVGQVMRETQGKADPQIVNELLDTYLNQN